MIISRIWFVLLLILLIIGNFVWFDGLSISLISFHRLFWWLRTIDHLLFFYLGESKLRGYLFSWYEGGSSGWVRTFIDSILLLFLVFIVFFSLFSKRWNFYWFSFFWAFSLFLDFLSLYMFYGDVLAALRQFRSRICTLFNLCLLLLISALFCSLLLWKSEDMHFFFQNLLVFESLFETFWWLTSKRLYRGLFSTKFLFISSPFMFLSFI